MYCEKDARQSKLMIIMKIIDLPRTCYNGNGSSKKMHTFVISSMQENPTTNDVTTPILHRNLKCTSYLATFGFFESRYGVNLGSSLHKLFIANIFIFMWSYVEVYANYGRILITTYLKVQPSIERIYL